MVRAAGSLIRLPDQPRDATHAPGRAKLNGTRRADRIRGSRATPMIEKETANKALLQAAQDDEDLKGRLEREHRELLEELRALIPGAEVLFGLLVAVRFTEQFGQLLGRQVTAYYVALVATAIALVLFIAPAAHHRIGFREGDKDYLIRKGNREAIAGSIAMGLAFATALHLVTDLVFGAVAAHFAAGALLLLIVWRWWSLAIHRKNTNAGRSVSRSATQGRTQTTTRPA
jgi:hypothetical protein